MDSAWVVTWVWVVSYCRKSHKKQSLKIEQKNSFVLFSEIVSYANYGSIGMDSLDMDGYFGHWSLSIRK